MVGFAHDVSGTLPNSSMTRVTESALQSGTENQLLSLVFDWAPPLQSAEGAVLNMDYSGNFIMAGGLLGLNADCDRIQELSGWLFRFVADIDLSGAEFVMGGNSDDDGDGYYEGGGFWAIRPTESGEFSFVVNTNGSLNSPQRAAFRIHNFMSTATSAPIVEIDSVRQVRGLDFLWQIDGEGAEQVHWIYFAKELSDGERVRISAPSN